MTHIHGETIEEVKVEAQARMQKSIEDLGRSMATIRTGRASIALLDPIKVDYYGTRTPLSQMATLATPNSSTLTIQPWDASQIGAIEKAIRISDLGINPANDGKIIRLAIPPLTKERRRVPGEASQQDRRAAPGSGAQHPAGSEHRGQEAGKGQEYFRRRQQARFERDTKGHGRVHQGNRQGGRREGEGDPRVPIAVGTDLAALASPFAGSHTEPWTRSLPAGPQS